MTDFETPTHWNISTNAWVSCFSNFTSSVLSVTCRAEYLTARTPEHAFQAFKTQSATERERILQAPTPAQAKRIGRRVDLRSDWEQVKVYVMYCVLDARFSQDAEFRKALLSTENRTIVEVTTWNDTFWGTDSSHCDTGYSWGVNALGQLLMSIRDRNQQEPRRDT